VTDQLQQSWQASVFPVREGEWAGWHSFGEHDPFEAQTGPFYFKHDADGRARCAFRAEARHMNGGGTMHGGCLMSFADFALFVIAFDAFEGQYAVTAAFNSDFTGAVRPGALVEAAGEVVKAGKSLIFVRGLVTVADDPVMSFSGVLKKLGKRSA
jgi:uncharacterized protein (TIGR00369 family)